MFDIKYPLAPFSESHSQTAFNIYFIFTTKCLVGNRARGNGVFQREEMEKSFPHRLRTLATEIDKVNPRCRAEKWTENSDSLCQPHQQLTSPHPEKWQKINITRLEKWHTKHFPIDITVKNWTTRRRDDEMKMKWEKMENFSCRFLFFFYHSSEFDKNGT